MTPEQSRRLNTWNQIARYLGRDRRTVMRWETRAGMPVHRVPGATRGSSVYAYTHELDAWLSGRPDSESPNESPDTPIDYTWERSPRFLVGAVVLVAALGFAVTRFFPAVPPGAVLARVESADDALIARTATGEVAWDYRHPEGRRFVEAGQVSRLLDLNGDGEKELLFAANTEPPYDLQAIEGEVFSLSTRGSLRWRRRVEDDLHFGTASFRGPWVSSTMDVIDVGGQVNVAWAVHDHRWWPSVVLFLNADGEVRGKFVNSGWVMMTNVLERAEGDVLVVAGINNAQGGAMIAVLDAERPSGTSPETPGGEFECLDCPGGDPLHYFVFPPSDVNVASGFPYNRTTSVERTEEGLRVIVLEGASASGIQWVYEFSSDFRLLGATPGDSYWPEHRLLRLAGKIDHDEDDCPERGPRTIRSWTRAGGWTEVSARTASPP